MNHKKKIYVSIIVIAMLCMISGVVNAAPVAISTSKARVSVGESFTVTVSSDYIGRINVSASNGITLSNSAVWVENGSATITATAKNAGTYTITATPAALSDGTKDVEGIGAKTATVTVKDNSNNNNNNANTSNSSNTNNNTNNNTSSNTNNNTTTKEPTFTGANKTAYATGDINVRSSYSSSSSAVGYLKKGDSVTIIGVGSNGWSKVTYNGKTAYIKSDLLTTTKPQEEKKETSTNKALKSLDIEAVNIEPEFNKDTTNYSVTVGKDIEKLNINAVAESEDAKVTITGNENFQIGENTVKILVTAEDGTVRTYTIIVKKQEEDTLGLASLKISGVSLNESFKSSIYEYTVDLKGKEDLTKLDIIATANKENATIEIIGNESLVVGENVITIMVKSEDGKENVTYQILVNKPEKTSVTITSDEQDSNSSKTFLYVSIGIFAIALLLIILIIVRSIKKSREEDYDEDGYGFNYNENNNYAEELYEMKNINKLHEEEIPMEKNKEALYNIENEVDFYQEDRRTRKKGKHSK